MLLQRSTMSRGSLGNAPWIPGNQLWLKTPENLPTTKRARREKNTVITISARMVWACLSILGATGATGLRSGPAGDKSGVTVLGVLGPALLTHSLSLSTRDENSRRASHKE